MKVKGIKSNFLGINKEYSDYENSEIVIVSAPFEKTVSYGKGTAKGPAEIIKASHYVEFYDEEMNREICFDKGIATLPELNIKDLSSKAALRIIEKKVTACLSDNKFVVTLGGEHSISSAPAKAYSQKYENLSILQFDAHSDLRDSYEGSKYSHASVMARIYEFNKNIVQVGIRAQCKEEADFIRQNKISTIYMRDIRKANSLAESYSKILSKLKKNVYITFDVDGFDPSVIAATGTPEPGGLFWDETMNFLKQIGKKKNIVGFDVVELAPNKNDNPSSFTTAKLVYKLLNYSFQN